MPSADRTNILILDDHRAISEDVKKRFPDSDRYVVTSYQNTAEFRNHIMAARDSNSCWIAILVMNDNSDQLESVKELTDDIKTNDSAKGVVVIYSTGKITDIKNLIINADAWIPKNSNILLRIYNVVKRLESEHTIVTIKKRRNLSLYILLAFAALSAVAAILARVMFPNYF
ncbi:MAG TPA: hypothetical protein VJ963_09930 [Bacteroidales bacterium]|nr:hypothetical protein [Bacteroidales bacterium]